jgi:uncharacterized protein (DUF433 family)
MEYLIDRITIDTTICGGKLTIRGKRITVQTILEFLSNGDSKEDNLKNYLTLEADDIVPCIRFAALLMNNQYSIKAIA